MADYGYTRQFVALAGTSAASSTYTSNPVLIADYAQMSVSRVTVGTGASRLSVQGSNADGFSAAIAEATWSNLTGITAQGLYTITPGARWIRFQRSPLDSQATIMFNARSS